MGSRGPHYTGIGRPPGAGREVASRTDYTMGGGYIEPTQEGEFDTRPCLGLEGPRCKVQGRPGLYWFRSYSISHSNHPRSAGDPPTGSPRGLVLEEDGPRYGKGGFKAPKDYNRPREPRGPGQGCRCPDRAALGDCKQVDTKAETDHRMYSRMVG